MSVSGVKAFVELGSQIQEALSREEGKYEGLTKQQINLLLQVKKSGIENGWFTKEMVESAFYGIIKMLDENQLKQWLETYLKSIDIERKADEVKENELVNVVISSLNTRNEYYRSYLDTKEQRKIIGDRLDVVSFSTDALANSYIEELSLLENVLETEITLLHGYFMFLHQNKELVSFIGVQP